VASGEAAEGKRGPQLADPGGAHEKIRVPEPPRSRRAGDHRSGPTVCLEPKSRGDGRVAWRGRAHFVLHYGTK